jgi:glycosyltransferase involved in cell wall biosynthesis
MEAHHFRRVQVWQRGVDLELFHPRKKNAAMRNRLTDGHSERVLALYVGRIAMEKGLQRLMKIFPLNPNVHLALVGEGPALTDMQEKFRQMPVTFAGKLLGTPLAEAYASSDFFVFPSTTETLGLVLLEAMASGLPLIAARSRPTIELIGSSGAGLMFPAGDPSQIGPLVHELIDGDIPLQVRSAYARTEAEHWGWDRSTQALMRFYHQAILYQLARRTS